MFERFTDRARRVVVLAQAESRLLHHDHIGTEHLLLGMLSEGEGIAGQALTSLGVSLETARRQVQGISGLGSSSPTGQIPFTRRAKKALELSLREALRLGHNYIGTEHILLGLVREGEGVGAQVLVKLGADLPEVRQLVTTLLTEGGARRTHADVPHLTAHAREPALVPGAGPFAEPPELRRVVALGNEYDVELPGGGRLTLLTLELWSTATELRFAVTPPAGGEVPAAAGESWTLTDDHGLVYPRLGAARSGGTGLVVAAHRYEALAEVVTRVTFAAPDGEPSVQVSWETGPGDQVTGTSGGGA